MKIFISMLLLSAAAAIAADPNEIKPYIARYLESFDGPQSYKDSASGTIFYVESDGRHVTAIAPDGTIRWHRDPFADAHLEFYRTKTPRIIFIGKPPQWLEARSAKQKKKVIGITFNSSQFGTLDVVTGDFDFAGQD